MADTERLMNKAQGDDIISALGTIAANILQVPSEKLIIDWSYTTLPASGNDHTIYAIPTGDADDPWDFYVWNDVDEEWVQFDWTFAVDSALSTTSENPVQNKVVKGALDGKVDIVSGKGLSTNDYTNEEKALVATIPDKADSTDVEGAKSVSGNPITLTDCAPINAESLVVKFEPKQEGSGDPSPTNIRPITGYTECEVDDVGVNQWDEEWQIGSINTDGTIYSGDVTRRTTSFICVQPNTEYYFKTPLLGGRNAFYNKAKQIVDYSYDGIVTNTFTTPNDAYYLRITVNASYGTTYNHDISINYPSTFTEYEPYHSSNATIQFGQTVYGGSVDFLTGVVTITDANIASYDGETLPSTWISDRDVYAAGTTPTTGAQVCYKLATPQTIQLTPQELKLLQGTNHITTNGTTINLGYQPDNVIGEVKGEIQEIKEMPYLRILDNDVDTEIKNYRLYYKFISSAYTLVNMAEMLQHRFIFVELIQNPSGTANHNLLHSALIDPRTINGFFYEMRASGSDTIVIDTDFANNRFNMYLRTSGSYEDGDPTNYYVTIRMVD